MHVHMNIARRWYKMDTFTLNKLELFVIIDGRFNYIAYERSSPVREIISCIRETTPQNAHLWRACFLSKAKPNNQVITRYYFTVIISREGDKYIFLKISFAQALIHTHISQPRYIHTSPSLDTYTHLPASIICQMNCPTQTWTLWSMAICLYSVNIPLTILQVAARWLTGHIEQVINMTIFSACANMIICRSDVAWKQKLNVYMALFRRCIYIIILV